MEVEQGTLEDRASLASSQHLQGWDEWPRCGAGPGWVGATSFSQDLSIDFMEYVLIFTFKTQLCVCVYTFVYAGQRDQTRWSEG